MSGPDSNCPCGFWAGLAPVDLEADAADQRERALDAQRRRLKPILSAALKHMPGTEVKCTFLMELMRQHPMLPELAKELAAEGGVDLDAEHDGGPQHSA